MVIAFAALGERTRIMNALSVKLICIGIVPCVAATAWGDGKNIKKDGVSITYDTATFSKVEIVEVKREPLPHPRDQLKVHPASLLFRFYTDSQSVGLIELYPMEDRSVDEVKTAYPELPERAARLSRLLHERPAIPQRYTDGTPKEIPTIQNPRAGQYFLSCARYLDFSWGSAVGFLVQYAQDASEYAVGSRLNYQIEGLTADGKIAVSAYFNVGHPDLPPTEKNGIVTDKNGEPIGEQAYMKYLRQMEKFLDEKSQTTFRPPLDSIQNLVGSLRFENVDLAGWGSKFNGKTTVIE